MTQHSGSISRRRFVGLAGATAAAGAMAGLLPRSAVAAPWPVPYLPQVGPRETLLLSLPADPTNLDPHSTVDGLSISAMWRTYDYLIQMKPGVPRPGDPIEVVSDIADAWSGSDDNLRYTFKLKSGLKFADGSPLDASAVKWSFDRMVKINKAAASNLRQLKATEAPDATTVEFHLSEPYAYFLPTIATYACAIINPKVQSEEKDGDSGQAFLANAAMGSGPYVLSEWRRGQQITLDYNPNWYGPAPAIKRVIIKIIPEATNARLQLERGDVDFLGLSISDVPSLEGKSGVRIEEVPSHLYILAYLNCTKPPLDNVKVRQAMNYAINYDEIIKELMLGKARRMRGPLAFGMEGYDDSLVGYDYDPDKAKQLLSEAGFPNGFELQLTYASQGAPGADDIALASQANLQAIGINVKIEKVAEPTRRERIDKNDFVWSVGGWSPPIPIPPWTMDKWYHSQNRGLTANRAFYSNPRVDELVTRAPTVLNPEQRIQMYREAQRIVVDEAPYILFYQSNQVFAMRDNLEGFQAKPGGTQFLNYERLSKR